LQDDKTININEHEMIKDRERIYDQNKARDAERLARKPSGVKVYEITVQNADQPGLVEYKPGAEDAATADDDDSDTDVQTTGTNAAKSAVADKKTPPPFDPMLDETERIMLDYISLLSKNGVLMAHE
jgi:hypothetical protein